MPLLARQLAFAALVLSAAVVASSEEPSCVGEDCGAAEEEDAALLQVQRVNASEDGELQGDYKNPCGVGYSSLPKQSTQKDCEAAGFKYVGNKYGAEDSSQCCVKAAWVCNLGTKRDCKPDGVANPKYLGTITWQAMYPRGNCCVPPKPATSSKATWSFDTQLFPKKSDCQTTKVSKSCTIQAFWTGAKCMTTAQVNGKYKVPTCKKSWGTCKGLSLGGSMCCTC
mmetsp:Transcript_46320/g.122340  ORF Transcript_46320/g.122340 Transcript_46320/m.122340 type:complete len:225 (-) Transcript_46320:169-843(-)